MNGALRGGVFRELDGVVTALSCWLTAYAACVFRSVVFAPKNFAVARSALLEYIDLSEAPPKVMGLKAKTSKA